MQWLFSVTEPVGAEGFDDAVGFVHHFGAGECVSAEHKQNHIGGGHLACIDGESAIVAGVVDDVVTTGCFLNEEAVAIAGVGLVAIFGIGGDLHLGCVGFSAAEGFHHHIKAERAFLLNKFIDRCVDAAIGFGGEKRFFAEVKFLP